MEVLVFGSLIDIIGKERIQMTAPSNTDNLQAQLMVQFPCLGTARYFLAVNKIMVQEKQPLREGDVVALMPAFSGG